MAEKIRLADGGGGEATAELIQKVFWSRLRYPELLKGNDASIIEPVSLAHGPGSVSTAGPSRKAGLQSPPIPLW